MATAIQTIQTPFGAASVQPASKGQTLIHTIANWMWLPSLVMGGMAIVVAIGLGIAPAAAANDLRAGFSASSQSDFETLKPLTAGTLFLGEALVLPASHSSSPRSLAPSAAVAARYRNRQEPSSRR